MQRYQLTPPETAGAETREIYLDFMRRTGSDRIPVYVQSLGHSPQLLRAYWEKTKGCLLEGQLPLLLKEMVVFVVSRTNGAAYCTACHAHAVLQLDRTITYRDLDRMVAGGGDFLPAAHQAAIRFAQRMAQDANAVDDAEFQALQDAGFSQDEVMELLGVIDLAIMFNTYTSGVRLPIDPEYLADVPT